MSLHISFLPLKSSKFVAMISALMLASCAGEMAEETRAQNDDASIEKFVLSQSTAELEVHGNAQNDTEAFKSIEYVTFRPSPLGAKMMGGITGEIRVEEGCLVLIAKSGNISQIFGVGFSEELDSLTISDYAITAGNDTYVLKSNQSFSGGTVSLNNSDRLRKIPQCYIDRNVELVFLIGG